MTKETLLYLLQDCLEDGSIEIKFDKKNNEIDIYIIGNYVKGVELNND